MRSIRWLFDVLAARKGQFKAISTALSISAINQIVSSGANFALGIYLVRVLTPTDFGLYGIGFAISLFYAGIGNALFLTQMVVHVPDKVPDDRLPYAARMLIALVVFCALTAITVGLLFVLGSAYSKFIREYLDLVFAIIAASVAYLLKDFFIRHAYTVRRESWALWVNVAVAVSLAASLLGQFRFASNLTPEGALGIYASSNMMGAVVGFALIRLPILTARLRLLGEDLREAWAGGSWALGGVAVTWAQTQAYMYITAVFVGPVGVAYANAARLLITPAIFLVPALSQVLMPRLASMRSSNSRKMLKISGQFSAALVVFSVIYSVVLLGLADVIAPVLLGAKYGQQIRPLAAAWCFVMIFQFSRSGSSIVLQVLKEFRALTVLNTVSVVVAIGAAVVLMRMIGVVGAILGTAIGELVLNVLLYRMVIQCKQRSN
jgi:O-antigen/teichoic acid export membrane protein